MRVAHVEASRSGERAAPPSTGTTNDAVPLPALVAAMAQRSTPLACETALFIALEAADALPEPLSAPSPACVRLTPDGGVEVAPGKRPASEREVVAAIAAIVGSVVHAPSPGVRALIERASAGRIATLESLRNELEAQLVPLNRSAARRVLGRLVREHHRVEALSPSPSLHAPLDATPHAIDASATLTEALPTAPWHATENETHPDATRTDPGLDATDTDPEGTTLEAFATRDAIDTQPDAPAALDVVTIDDGTSDEAVVSAPIETPRARRREPLSGVVLAVSLMITAGVGFVAYKLRTRAPTYSPPPAALR